MYGVKQDLNIHFIGAGGIGMSGIAEILLNLGYKVSGSDLRSSDITERLISKGAEIFVGHDEENIKNAQIIVYSSAIDETNPEIKKARELRLPIIKRAEMLAELMRLKFGVAIAGTHGKTTTTSMLATILEKLNYKPTYIIGGIVKNLGRHAFNGESDVLVAEADESDGSFLLLNPIMSIVTNIDNDHMSFYKTEENLYSSFLKFVNKIPFYGVNALSAHDKRIKKLINEIKKPYKTFGIIDETLELDPRDVDYKAFEIKYSEQGSNFKVTNNEEEGSVNLKLGGKHNILNALGAIAIAHNLGASLSDACSALEEFVGVGRRFEKVYEGEKLTIIDDYGHHPTELTATIEAVRKSYADKKVVLVFEPHRYTRTKEHWSEFVANFLSVDEVYIAPIYPASEKEIEGITSDNLVQETNNRINKAKLLGDWEDLFTIFDEYKNRDTIILTMGAGSISKIVKEKISKWT